VRPWSRKFGDEFFTAVREGVGLSLLKGENLNEKEFVEAAVLEKTQNMKEDFYGERTDTVEK